VPAEKIDIAQTPLPRVTVIGIGADGWSGLSESARTLILAAPVVIGGSRQLSLLPEAPEQQRQSWPSPLLAGLDALLREFADRHLVVLASGDPLVSGIGSTLIDRLGRAAVRIVPAMSCVALATARMGWPAETVDILTVVGRHPATLLAHLGPGRRLIVMSSDEHTPSLVAAMLVDAGYGASSLTVLGDLGAATESVRSGTASQWQGDSARLNVMCLHLAADPGTIPMPSVPGLPDTAFEHDGQLTKRDLRASALSRLTPVPGQLLWDVGAGAGSIAIEWSRSDSRCTAIAFERDPARAVRIARNATALGVPDLVVVTGAVPQSLTGRLAPDAIFIGGGATTPGVIDTCWAALRPGGRLVVHSVTLETDAVLFGLYKTLGGELMRLSVEHACAIGTFTGWTPARAVTQFCVHKSNVEEQAV